MSQKLFEFKLKRNGKWEKFDTDEVFLNDLGEIIIFDDFGMELHNPFEEETKLTINPDFYK
jgi:hypothetical protein